MGGGGAVAGRVHAVPSGLLAGLHPASYNQQNLTEIVDIAAAAPADAGLRLVVEGPDFNTGETISTTFILPLGPANADGAARLNDADLLIVPEGDAVNLEEPLQFGPSGSVPGQKLGEDFDFYGDTPVQLVAVEVPADRMAKEVFYIPALLVLALVVLMQRRRTDVPAF